MLAIVVLLDSKLLDTNAGACFIVSQTKPKVSGMGMSICVVRDIVHFFFDAVLICIPRYVTGLKSPSTDFFSGSLYGSCVGRCSQLVSNEQLAISIRGGYVLIEGCLLVRVSANQVIHSNLTQK